MRTAIMDEVRRVIENNLSNSDQTIGRGENM